MRIFDFVSVKLTLLLIFGIFLGFYLEPKLFPTLLFLGLFLISLGFAWKTNRFFSLSAALVTIGFGTLITLVALGKDLPNHYSHLGVKNTGVWQVKITEVLKPNLYQQRYVVKAEVFEKEKCTGKLILNIARDSLSTPLQVDDEVVLLAKLDAIRPPSNPHQFDYKDYLKKQGIHNQLSVQSTTILHDGKSTSSLFGLAMNTREHLISNLSKESYDEDVFGVIQALLLGKREDISEETYTHYKNAGAVHILAVSGLHVGVLLFLFQFVLQPLTYLPKGETIRLAFVVLLLWGYAFLAGLSPSVVRAVTMFSFVAYAQYLNRPTNSFNIIALSMLFILLVKPLYLFQVGFQMSYAAVFAIVWIYPKLQQFWFPEHFLIRKIWQLLSVSLAAQIGVLPISLFYFHQFPSLFFISNLLIIPFLGVILGMGILTLFLSLLNILPQVLVTFYNFIIKVMNSIIGWVAHQESFVFKEIPLDGAQMMLLYLILIGLVLFLSKTTFKNIMVLGFGIVGLQAYGLWSELQIRNNHSFIVAHSSKTPVLLHQNGRHLTSFTLDRVKVEKIVTTLKVGDHLETVQHETLGNTLQASTKNIYRVDSFAIFPPQQNMDILWLSESPKINLERWLDYLQPKMVIMDGTNYRTYSARWKKSCQNKKIPFHDTREKGAYYFK
ncbi:ComEC/Rec2 family competence protein [Flagellimonas sp.]|uniref:ComEC/Rec2 family competence protein n=1 Tax=Flagellimonas sp. TaxID=2058762 RepID=UPI003F4A17AF